MAAPSGTVWGSAVQGSKTGRQGKIGIYTSVSSTNTQTTVNIQVWFWTIYSCSDGTNNFYCNIGTGVTSATTKIGSVDINHTVNTGTGWSTSNQTRLYNVTKTYTRGTSAATYKIYAKYNGIDMLPDKTMYVNASFTVPALTKYTVTFNANGGSGAPSSQTKYYGKTLTLSSTKPTRSGYTFVGWGMSASDTSKDYDAGGSYTANAGDTLYAIWKKTITLSYNVNGGSGTYDSQSATVYNAATSYKFTLSSTKPTRSGYTFVGWNTSKTATSGTSAGGTITISANTTLYAIWKKTITLSYNANGGSGAPSSQSATVYNATTSYKFTLSTTKPTKTGHSFLGWSTSNTATSASYSAGGTITLSANDTLYAVWKANTYAVKFNANGGSLGDVPSSQTKTYGETLQLPTAKPTRTNYTFLGWATSASATTATYQAGANYTTNSAATLYAVWKLAYTKPTVKITSLTWVKNTSGTITGCKVAYSWSCMSGYLPTAMSVKYTAASDSGGTKMLTTPSALSGTATDTVSYTFDPAATYTFVVTLTDSQGSHTASKRIDGTPYTIHCRPGGNGIAFGKASELDGYVETAKSMVFNNSTYIYGVDTDGTLRNAVTPVNQNGNTTFGYGGYEKKNGSTNLYGNAVNIYSHNGVSFGKDATQADRIETAYSMIFDEDKRIYGLRDGATVDTFIPINEYGNTVIGYGHYEAQVGNTNVYGNAVNINANGNVRLIGSDIVLTSNNASEDVRPYRRTGDSITLTIRTTGYISSEGKKVYFLIPFAVPIIGTSSVTVSSGTGFTLRQGAKYLYGSSADTTVYPANYSASVNTYMGVLVTAEFNNNTNVNNNDTVGISWNGTITFN